METVELRDVYSYYPATYIILYSLLAERTPEQSISHKRMPTHDEHVAFVDSRPYKAWYLVADGEDYVGAVYLTKRNEIGISIFKAHQGKGYGHVAVKALMDAHEGPFLANINPKNAASIKMFEWLGFTHVQNTYEL